MSQKARLFIFVTGSHTSIRFLASLASNLRPLRLNLFVNAKFAKSPSYHFCYQFTHINSFFLASLAAHLRHLQLNLFVNSKAAKALAKFAKTSLYFKEGVCINRNCFFASLARDLRPLRLNLFLTCPPLKVQKFYHLKTN